MLDKLIFAIVNINVYGNLRESFSYIKKFIKETPEHVIVGLMDELGCRYVDRKYPSKRNMMDFIYSIIVLYKNDISSSIGFMIIGTLMKYIHGVDMFKYLCEFAIGKTPNLASDITRDDILYFVKHYDIYCDDIEYYIVQLYLNYHYKSVASAIFIEYYNRLHREHFIYNRRFIGNVCKYHDIPIVRLLLEWDCAVYYIIVNEYCSQYDYNRGFTGIIKHNYKSEYLGKFLSIFPDIAEFIQKRILSDKTLNIRYWISNQSTIDKLTYIFTEFINCTPVLANMIKNNPGNFNRYICPYYYRLIPNDGDINVKYLRSIIDRHLYELKKHITISEENAIFDYIYKLFFRDNFDNLKWPPSWNADIAAIHYIISGGSSSTIYVKIHMGDYLNSIVRRNERILASRNSEFINSDLNERKADINVYALTKILSSS